MIKVILYSLFIIPYLSLFFLNTTVIRRYLPVALFVTVINTIIDQIAYVNNWWRYTETLFSWDKITAVHLEYSFFMVITIWIFHYTFGRFWLYLLVNFCLDAFSAFVFFPTLQKLKMDVLKISGITIILLMVSTSVVIYLFQNWLEGKEEIEVHFNPRKKEKA